jgi:hypothetical protein
MNKQRVYEYTTSKVMLLKQNVAMCSEGSVGVDLPSA